LGPPKPPSRRKRVVGEKSKGEANCEKKAGLEIRKNAAAHWHKGKSLLPREPVTDPKGLERVGRVFLLKVPKVWQKPKARPIYGSDDRRKNEKTIP